jgi:hypothetical protein
MGGHVYEETFSVVAKITTVSLLVAIATATHYKFIHSSWKKGPIEPRSLTNTNRIALTSKKRPLTLNRLRCLY